MQSVFALRGFSAAFFGASIGAAAFAGSATTATAQT